MAAYDACISLAGLVVDLVIIMAVLTVSRACNIRSCLIGVMYLRPGAHLVSLHERILNYLPTGSRTKWLPNT